MRQAVNPLPSPPTLKGASQGGEAKTFLNRVLLDNWNFLALCGHRFPFHIVPAVDLGRSRTRSRSMPAGYEGDEGMGPAERQDADELVQDNAEMRMYPSGYSHAF